jgi:hypothetical protein
MNTTSSKLGSPSALGTQVVINTIPSQIQLITIKAHISVFLDLHKSNYGQWTQSIPNVVFGKFGLTNHIDCSQTALSDSNWVQSNLSIDLWFYTMV